LFRLVLESHDGRAPGADSEEKHEPASDITLRTYIRFGVQVTTPVDSQRAGLKNLHKAISGVSA
jgi:hypothetical protein